MSTGAAARSGGRRFAAARTRAGLAKLTKDYWERRVPHQTDRSRRRATAPDVASRQAGIAMPWRYLGRPRGTPDSAETGRQPAPSRPRPLPHHDSGASDWSGPELPSPHRPASWACGRAFSAPCRARPSFSTTRIEPMRGARTLQMTSSTDIHRVDHIGPCGHRPDDLLDQLLVVEAGNRSGNK